MNGSVKVKLNFGLANVLERSFTTGTTLDQVLSDQNIQSALGFGGNVVGKIDGVIQDGSQRLIDGDEIDIEVRANTKA
jgi:hypothetical protein